MQRIEEYNQLLEDSKEVLRKDTTLWKGFLKFATQFTHYQFFDQILIYVQNPKATACATFDQWKKIGRYVRKGEHSIVLLDETGKRGKLRHIFDVTATGPDQEFEYRPKPILPEQREELARKLNAAYSRENSAYAADSARWDGDLEHTLSQIALSMTQEYYNLSPDQAAAQSESTEIPAYYIATATSAMYLLLEKYGFSQEAESLDFSCMNQLDMETFSGVGNAASAILSWTARLVRTVQREQVRERGNEHERNDNGRYSETDHISSGGRFPGSEHRTPGERRESAGVTEVRDDAEKLSEGEQPSGIRESGSEWNTVSGDGEGGRSSGSDQGTGITATAQGRGSDRGTETERSAQMGGTDGILPPSGGGNYSDGTGVQLTLSDYFEIRPTDRENVSDSDTPKAEHEEIQIEQTEQAAGETPAAFVIPEEDYIAARASTLNAHFTSPAIIRGIYAALERMGFQGGNILEPAMGVGNFFGMLPTTLLGSRLYGIELDSISGRIAQKLYPMANITVAGFETTNQRDFYDVAVGNVPFGNYKVNDRAYNRLGFSIHNYFFAKSLDQIRPGGIIAYVTSHYTMDSKNPSARRYLAQRAKLLGAIRLPDHAFRANAGAEVVADILFLQKREHIVETEDDWIYLGQTDKGYAINTYFLDHPEMILGTLEEQSTQFGKEYTVKADQNQDLSKLLLSAVTKIQGHYEPYEPTAQPEPRSVSVSDRRQQNAVLPADPSVRNFSYTLVDGEVYYRENSTMRKIDRSDAARDRTKGLLKIRDALNQVIQLQVEDATDEEIQRAQRKLGIEYNLFSKRYGLINSRQNALMMDGDSSYFLLCSLENLDKDGNLRSKADIFTKRTIRAQQEITFVETPADALAVSIGEKGHVDLPYMADLLGKGGEAEQEQITRELSGVIFRDPQEKEEQRAWKTADEYLSGNVRDKLRMAQLAAQRDVRYEENVRALQEAQPKNLTASEIDVRLGATWIDAEYIEAFMYETFHTPYYQRQRIKLTFAAVTGEWQISGKTFALENDVSVYNRYGTARMGAYAILEQTLNLRTVTVYDRVTDAEGTTRSVVNPRETMLAQQKQAAIKEAFAGWIWKDPQRRQRLEQVYNERFNNLRPAEFSGEHIRFHGMNPAIQLRTHQKNAIAHILYGGNTLLAHEVGAGKTYTMVAAAMESKRLGLCQKSLFVVPNHLTLQWANDFLKLYPAANLLVASKKDFETANRKKFCARIATGDYDAIIIGHSQFERIPVSIERQERLLQKQPDEIENALRESMNERDQSFTVKQMEKTRKSLKIRLEKLQAQERKDDIVTFEQLGVDRLFVDEAHAYKNLFLYTKMRNIAGLSTSEAQKSTDMYMKCRYMDELTGGKGIIFATGTPISNSMTELYTMMRYLQYDALQERGLTQFDAWASTFGETVTASELAPEGTGYRQKTRFAKFFNLPELMNLFKQTADIKTKDQLNLPVPEVETKTIVAQPSELQKKMVAELSERAAAVHNGAVDPTIDNMLKITSDGRKIGLDQRLMNPLLSDDTASKVNLCVGNVLRIWEEGKEKRLTQLIFCDNSVPKPNTFNIYDDVKGKLIAAGIPEMEIAYIHDADTEIKKKNLFSKVNDGQVRILLGSTQKMGAGTNVQERLIAIHHLDVGWRPADMIQRNGRIIRQGNRNLVVQVYNYVTEGTFDSYLWQTLENKQKFISQIMTSKSPVRSCEDVDEQVLTYAEVKALCAGDDRIKEKMDLEVDIARLRMLKAEHQSMQYRLEDQLLKTFPEQIREKEGIIQKLDADIKTTEQYPPFAENTIFLEILGKVYTDQKEAAKAFLEAGKTCKDTRSIRIGSYRGFELEGYVNVITAEIQIAVKGKLSHPFELSDVPALNLKRLDSALNKLPERMILERGKLEALYQQREDAQKQLNTPFPQEDELREKTKRLEELAVELDVDAGREPQENEDNEKTTMKISKPTGIRQSRFSRFRRQKDEKEEDADEDIDF